MPLFVNFTSMMNGDFTKPIIEVTLHHLERFFADG